MTSIANRLRRLLRVIRSDARIYSPVAYLFGASLPGVYDGDGPVAWLRGWPRPELARDEGRIELGHVGLFPGVKLHCRGSGRIAVGDGTFLNRDVRVFSATDVVIGEKCMVSWQTCISDVIEMGEDDGGGHEAVQLGDHVWIGSRVVLCGGTRLGTGCVVAAGSVVRGEFPPGSVIAGKPAEIAS